MKRIYVACLALIIAVASHAQTELGIVNRQLCGSFWRYDFNYETVDTDGTTPITLSASIFMSKGIHDKTATAKGCALLNHYTITTDAERPTNVSSSLTLEGIIASTPYFVVESDGIGFGITKDRKQSYLQGRTTARNDIDALLYARKLLEQEEFEVPKTVANLGYSQGGHSGMWVNRLVAEGYRGNELPKIDISILGGGPYDIYSHYRYIVNTGVTQYPVAIPLIANGVVDSGECDVDYSDLFNEEFIAHIPTWFDSKEYTTTAINNLIFNTFGDGNTGTVEVGKLMSEAFLNPESDVMQRVEKWMKANSLVYEDWAPSKTDTIVFVHSRNDYVVPYLNMESLETFLHAQGYETFSVDSSPETAHTDTGTYYAMLVATILPSYTPKDDATGILPLNGGSTERTHGDVYGIDGRLVMKQAPISSLYDILPKGIYIVNGRKIAIR